ncbi:glycoside hydrolase family 13 protein [Alloscardovia criceti]|uniref:glycoside hydrolase family 13 protein n=1 Tax=Alloscardovia criceti TaxID=356828 RepID=UPI00037406EA|nr:alpha-glucosidase [Alloscardovia criceti]
MQNNHWWNNAVVYQIYPKSFQDSNGDGIGDLRGIINRLEYLNTLGIDVIWLSPIYESPQVDNGYDISDYQSINPDFGTLEDFDELVSKAHDLGIHIMMDLVVNHTSDQHEWFKKSCSDKEGSYRDYYIWRDARFDDKGNPVPPNNWGSFFATQAWEYDEDSKQYYLHLFAKEQPDLNWENPRVRQNVYAMMNWWAQRGVDGFRMDVISYISKPHELPDGEIRDHDEYANPEKFVANGPRIHEFLREMNENVMSKHRMITVGETPGVTTQEAEQYANLDNSELNMVFQFEHMGLDSNPDPTFGRWYDGKAKLEDIRANLTKWQYGLEGKAWNSLYWNNHDQPRVVSRFGNDTSEEYRKASAKMLATVLHMMQGTPYIYQGEEIGMTNAYFTDIHDYNDLDSINPYRQFVENQKIIDKTTMMRYISLHSRDNARTPMQWNSEKQSGFTTGTPWLKVNPAFDHINVEESLADSHSIFFYYQKLIALRHNEPIITHGKYELVEGNTEDSNIFAYTRTFEDEVLLVLANWAANTVSHNYELRMNVPEDAQILIGNYDEGQRGSLQPYEAKVYKFSKQS